LTIGATVAGTIDETGKQDHYTFTLAAATRLVFDSLTNNSNINWSLVGPAGLFVDQRAFTNSDSFDNGYPLVSLPAGNYTLTVDGVGDTTGAYQFRLLDLASATAITPGTPVSGTLDPAIETDLYRFTAAAGDQFFFDVQTGIGNATWRLVDPFSNIVFSTSLNSDVNTLTLAQAGTYTLMLEGRRDAGSGSAAYAFNVQPVADGNSTLTIGATVSGTIDETGERDHYNFTLAAATRLAFDSFTNNSNINWSLVGPAGLFVDQRLFTSSDSFDGNPLLNLPAGNYTLTVDGVGDATGPYQFRLLDLASATAITPGTAISGTLDPATETDLYSFTAAAGDQFSFDEQTAINNANWRLVDPFNNILFSQSFNSDVNTLTLAQAGTYTIMLEGRRDAGAGSAAYMFNVQPIGNTPQLPFTGTALTLGSTVSDNISAAGEEDDYIFTLAGATRLYFDSLTNNGSIQWSLVGPAGTAVSNRSFPSSDANDIGNPVISVPAGSYQLRVFGSGAATGAYSFRLSNLDTAGAANAITPGTPFSGQLNPGNETDFFSFTATAGQMFYFDVQSATSANGHVRLIDPFTNVVLDTTLNTDVDTFTLTQGGTYIGLIEGRFNESSPSSYTYNLQPISAPAPTALTLGTTTSGAISLTGETDVYTFSLASVSRLYFDSLTNNNNFNWTLVGPSGTVVSHRSFLGSDSNDLGNPVLGGLPAGSYTLTIDGTTDNTGAYSFRLSDLDVAGAANAITPGTPFSGQLNPGNETDFFSFTATAGQMFYFDVQSATSGNGHVRLIDPFANVVLDTALSTDVDTFTLTQGGTYIGLIEGRYNETSPSSYTYNLQPVPAPVPTALTLGTTTTGAISLTGETDVYTFSLASASRLYFDSLTNNNNFNWTLVGPAGTVVSHRSFLGSDSNDLGNPVLGGLAAGSYALTIDGTTDNTGAYSFRLSNVDTAGAANAITPGTSFSGQLNPGNETDFFSFTANAGQMFYFDVQSATSGNGKVRLIDPFTNVVLDTGLSTDVDTFTLTQDGTYIGLIEGRYNESSPSSYTYNLQPVPAPAPTALTLGTTTSGAISLTGETDVYTFSLANVSRLYFDSLTNNNNFNWTLVGPTGTVVSHRSFLGSDSNDLGNPVLSGLPVGPYTLTIDGTTDNIGAYSFRLSNVDTAGATNAITPGTPFSGQLNPGNETDFFSFTATAGQMFYFDVQSATSGNGKVRLIDPFTNVVLDTALSTDVDTFTLTQAGTYIGLVEGRYNESSPSSYTYNLQPVVNGGPFTLLSPGFSITPTSGLVTTEAGGIATFTVVLCTQPTADVTISLTSSDTTEGQVSPTSLTFTHDNYNIAQTVTVTGVNDDEVDGDIAYTIITGSATSVDSAYNGIDPPDVSVTNKNDDLFCSTVVINTNDAGAGSLREAINCANTTLGTDTISFNIPGSGVHTISPLSALPAITDPVIIDGYTQPGASPNTNGPKQGDNANLLIELNGSNAGTSIVGLNLGGSGGSKVRGLAINHFATGVLVASSDNLVAGNFIGTDPTGTVGSGMIYGVRVGGSNNRIGAADADDGVADGQMMARNVISGCSAGIIISGAANLLVEGNLIGTQANGTARLANHQGIDVAAASGILIGGSAFGAGNVISGNILGIYIFTTAGTAGSAIQGNLIGTDVSGTVNLGNTNNGLQIYGPFDLIGGTTPGTGNVIAYSTNNGITIQSQDGDPPANNISILGNSIYQNGGLGIDLNDDGPTLNDLTIPADADTGANNGQNYPVIAYATRDVGKLKVTYNVPSAPANSTYPIRVEFFLADANGQGKTYLGFDTFTTGDFAASGKTVTFTTAAPAKVLDKIVATATDSLTAAANSPPGNTSEFSPAATIVSPWQNPGRLRWDVNDDTFVSADDVLAIINYINAKGSGLLPDDAPNEKPFLDVDGDNNVVAADVIDIINYINAGRRLGGEAEGESDPLPAPSGSSMPGNDVMALLAADVAAEAVRKRRGGW
jgi:small nuclear ribonucleoprotein (snRNP)-like protein/putative NADH-flavin reductase